MTMLEVQEAAKIITESIDRDAKVIFGAIRDDRLKKNELKVTVIASGFPERSVQRALGIGTYQDKRGGAEEKRENIPATTPFFSRREAPPVREEDEEEDGKSFAASLLARKEKDATGGTTATREAEKNVRDYKVTEETDDWSSIPAFLRRGKK